MATDTTRMDRFNISSIETFFDSLLRGALTDNLFFTEIPTSPKKSWESFAVVDCGNPLRDKDAYEEGTVLVFLYARQNAPGRKDVKALQTLEKDLNELILANDDQHYHISRRGSYSGYDSVNDLFYNVIQLNLIIT